VSEKQH